MSRLWIVTVGIIFFSFCLSRQVYAFAVAPSILEVSGSRGETVQQNLTLINSEETDSTYYFETIKFEAQDESGSPKFIPYSQDHSDLPDWINLSTKKLVVPARSFVEFPFSITIPPSTASGSYYAAITVSETEPITNSATPIIQTKTASLIFLTVEGETKEQAGLLDLIVSPNWNDRLDGTITYRIQNQGNVFLKPSGTITLKDIFGRTLTTLETNQEGNRILPETTRTFSNPFGGQIDFWQNPIIGPVTAELSLTYGNSEKTLVETATFWILPWKIILMVLGGLIILSGITFSLKTKKK